MSFSRPHLPTPSTVDKRLPVFVFPEELSFLSSDESSHKQVLTLYNPYDFTLQYHVMCNAPQKYSVTDAKGNIEAHSCVDVVVRHTQADRGPFDVTDKFRLDIYAEGKLVGRKQLLSTLTSCAPNDAPELRSRSRNLTVPGGSGPLEDSYISSSLLSTSTTQAQRGQQTPGVLLILLALFCVVVLFLPLEGKPTSLPDYLHISVNQKLIVAFVLGRHERQQRKVYEHYWERGTNVWPPLGKGYDHPCLSFRNGDNGHLKILV